MIRASKQVLMALLLLQKAMTQDLTNGLQNMAIVGSQATTDPKKDVLEFLKSGSKEVDRMQNILFGFGEISDTEEEVEVISDEALRSFDQVNEQFKSPNLPNRIHHENTMISDLIREQVLHAARDVDPNYLDVSEIQYVPELEVNEVPLSHEVVPDEANLISNQPPAASSPPQATPFNNEEFELIKNLLAYLKKNKDLMNQIVYPPVPQAPETTIQSFDTSAESFDVTAYGVISNLRQEGVINNDEFVRLLEKIISKAQDLKKGGGSNSKGADLKELRKPKFVNPLDKVNQEFVEALPGAPVLRTTKEKWARPYNEFTDDEGTGNFLMYSDEVPVTATMATMEEENSIESPGTEFAITSLTQEPEQQTQPTDFGDVNIQHIQDAVTALGTNEPFLDAETSAKLRNIIEEYINKKTQKPTSNHANAFEKITEAASVSDVNPKNVHSDPFNIPRGPLTYPTATSETIPKSTLATPNYQLATPFSNPEPTTTFNSIPFASSFSQHSDATILSATATNIAPPPKKGITGLWNSIFHKNSVSTPVGPEEFDFTRSAAASVPVASWSMMGAVVFILASVALV